MSVGNTDFWRRLIRPRHLQKSVGFLSPEDRAYVGMDVVGLIGDPGCPVKVTLVIIYAKDDTLLAVCHSTVQLHLFLTLFCYYCKYDSTLRKHLQCHDSLWFQFLEEASFLTVVWPVLINHLATELLPWIKVNQERARQIHANSLILVWPEGATCLFSLIFITLHKRNLFILKIVATDTFLGRFNE